ncbi:MAG: deoxyguanosinetriphosphate triphosphohydrolase, partial [Nitrospinaceae bacterium]|nr:deoxyguanosinetriphosphate triphosphohydrolase [Nitrospinaceae bacterium]
MDAIRSDLENRELALLAPYAAHSAASLGRAHPEPEHSLRPAFQRDRDRIIHTTAFRRLEYKTQVFVNHEGDHYRTRLTHTIEVGQIARSIARALSLNEELAEAVALAHDLGHPPFGHAGEKVLDDLMVDSGGFEHNLQALRIVEVMERRYPGFPGLNLTWETREGIIKHMPAYTGPMPEGLSNEIALSLEAQAVDVADEIAYNNHDLDDAMRSELFSEEDAMEASLWAEHYEAARSAYPTAEADAIRHETIRRIVNAQVNDLIESARERIKALSLRDLADVRLRGHGVASFSEEMSRRNLELKAFLMRRMYRNERVVHLGEEARRTITALFEAYI